MQDDPPWTTAIITLWNYAILIVFGFVRDHLFRPRQRVSSDYAPLLQDWQDFYTRRLYNRIQDCFSRPICSAPAAWVSVMNRDFDGCECSRMILSGSSLTCLNLSSYNYLGFAGDQDTRGDAIEAMRRLGVSQCSSRTEMGTTDLHLELENRVARFMGKEAAIVVGMGFASNSTVIPALMDKGCLIISDELNHSSIVTGARLSSAAVRVFKHNCHASLEKVIRNAIAYGQPRSKRPWRKIMVFTEGLFSMEGELCDLPRIVAVCKKYKVYLFVDEAHSIGAIGKSGRGIHEHYNVPPGDITCFMGTFTKAFGSVGGYIAASSAVIDLLRRKSIGNTSACSMSPACVQQALMALSMIQGEDGTTRGRDKMEKIKQNSNMFRHGLTQLGYQTLGDRDSPVIPCLLFQPAKLCAFSRACLVRKLAVVVVGSPATPLLKGRVRFCISAEHTEEDLKSALQVLDQVGDEVMVKYDRKTFKVTIYEKLMAFIMRLRSEMARAFSIFRECWVRKKEVRPLHPRTSRHALHSRKAMSPFLATYPP